MLDFISSAPRDARADAFPATASAVASTFGTSVAAAPKGWAGSTVTDTSGTGVYSAEAWKAAPRIDRAKLAELVHADPARIVLLGEGHGQTSDLTSTRLAEDLKAKGDKVVYAIEMPSNVAMRGLVGDYQSGKIAKKDFVEKYTKEYADYTIKAGEHTDRGQALVEGNYNATLLSYVKEKGIGIGLIDTGRDAGGSRNAAMATNISKLANDNPDARVVVSLGATHAARTGEWPPDKRDSVAFKADLAKPAGLRLEETFGDAKVLSLFVDGSRQSIVAGKMPVPLKTFDHIVVGPPTSLDEL